MHSIAAMKEITANTARISSKRLRSAGKLMAAHGSLWHRVRARHRLGQR